MIEAGFKDVWESGDEMDIIRKEHETHSKAEENTIKREEREKTMEKGHAYSIQMMAEHADTFAAFLGYLRSVILQKDPNSHYQQVEREVWDIIMGHIALKLQKMLDNEELIKEKDILYKESAEQNEKEQEICAQECRCTRSSTPYSDKDMKKTSPLATLVSAIEEIMIKREMDFNKIKEMLKNVY